MQGVVFNYDDREEKKVYRNPTQDELVKRGVLPYLDPLPTWNISEPGNILRVFERGQKLPQPEIGNPSPEVEPGKSDKQLSPRGLGTSLRTDPVFIGIQKTRLMDPILWFLGTNDHPGDFRSSGCSSCHVVYANDRTKYATFKNAKGEREYAETDMDAGYGNLGHAAADSKDPTIPKTESGHPIRHLLTNAIPNSQCVICHMHPGTSYANTYMGYMWYDNESDGEFMYPNRSHKPTPEQEWYSLRRNPESSSLKGLWGNLYPEATSHAGELAGNDFLERSGEPRKEGAGKEGPLNNRLNHNQFADFHGHGWMFRAIYKKDKFGNMLDEAGAKIDPNDPNKWDKGVHLKDIHLAKGMQCVDCHFVQDAHGDGRLYGETRNAIEITCIDCHGTSTAYATLKTSGPAAQPGGRDIKKKFEWDAGVLKQHSAMNYDITWEVTQTLDTVNPLSAWSLAHPESAKQSRYAKTMHRDRNKDGSMNWVDIPTVDKDGKKVADDSKLSHGEGDMELLYLPHVVDDQLRRLPPADAGQPAGPDAAQREPLHPQLHAVQLPGAPRGHLHARARQRPQGHRHGRDPVKQGGKIVPVRSSSAIIVSSQNAQREWIYSQQQTVSGEGYSGQTFNPHFPHATSGPGTTKTCTDCHVSKDGDNNAWMAQFAASGHQHGQLPGALRLRRRGQGRACGGGCDRAGRPAGGLRQPSPRAGVPR